MAANVVINILLLEEIERLNERRYARLRFRNLRDTSDPFHLPDYEFIKNFRLSKHCALDLITVLTPHMRNTVRITAIPITIRVLAALNFYGHGSYQHGIGGCHNLGMSQPSLSRSVTEVTRLINIHLLRRWIKFPSSIIMRNEKKLRFRNKYNIDGIIGAIDCTHISIIAPFSDDPHYPRRVYFNRKGYTSINTQIICDSELNILNINARYPGGTHDSAIWMSSAIKPHITQKYLNNELQDCYLIGDSGYPLEPWLMTPVDGAAEGTPEFRYNLVHCSARNCIERLNGVLKSRFRCLLRHRTLNYHPVKAGFIINACAVLHNMANHYNINLPDDYNQEIPEPAQNLGAPPIQHLRGQWHAAGLRRRNVLINLINEQ